MVGQGGRQDRTRKPGQHEACYGIYPVLSASQSVSLRDGLPRGGPFGGNPRWNWLLATLLALLHAALAVTAAQKKSPTFDEPVHLTAGYSYWLTNDFRLDAENGIFQQRWAALPLLISRPSFVSAQDPSWREGLQGVVAHRFFYETGNDSDYVLLQGRLMIALIAAGLCLLIYRCAADLFGPVGGLIAEVMAVFDPNMLAHGALVTSDITAAFFFMLTLWSTWRLFQVLNLSHLAVAAVALSGLLLSKFSGLLAAPMIATICLIRVLSRRPQLVQFRGWIVLVQDRWKKAGLMLALAMVLCLTVVFSIWSAYAFRFRGLSGSQPAPAIWDYTWNLCHVEDSPFDRILFFARDHHLLPEAYLTGLAYVQTHSAHRPSFLDGRWSLTGFHSFFPRAFAYKSSLPLLCLMGAGLVAALLRWKRKWMTQRSGVALRGIGSDLARLSPFWVLFVVYGGAAITTSLNIGHRHILPIYPPLFILCGAAALLFRGLQQRGIALLISLLIFWQVGESFAVRPDYLSYFNELAGGPRNGYRHLVDSSVDWGQELPGLRAWLTSNISPNDRVYLSYFGSADPRWYGIDAISLPAGDGKSRTRLEGGIYCISATNLEQVYSRAMGQWARPYERYYQRLLAKAATSDSAGVATPQPVDFHGSLDAEEVKAMNTLQFARLCAYLRQTKPFATVGNSIFVFCLTSGEVQRALYGPPAELMDQIQVADR